MKHTKNFAEVIHAKVAADADLAEAIELESFNTDIAMKVYDLRIEAGLTQKQLAERVGTYQSVISRIEAADYDGHSFSLLRRVAAAFGQRLRIEFTSDNRRSAAQRRRITTGGSKRRAARRRIASS